MLLSEGEIKSEIPAKKTYKRKSWAVKAKEGYHEGQVNTVHSDWNHATCYEHSDIRSEQLLRPRSSLNGRSSCRQTLSTRAVFMEPLLAAYQQGDKNEIERVVKNLDDYVNRRSPSFKKKEREKMEKLAQRPEFKMLLNEFYTARHSADIQRAYRLNRTRGFYYSNPDLPPFNRSS